MTLKGEVNQFDFTTIDYNEFGMLISTNELELNELFIEECDVTGTIGDLEYSDISFEGFIVRQLIEQNELQIAIKFTRPPYSESDSINS
jgi:hypothetical protein